MQLKSKRMGFIMRIDLSHILKSEGSKEEFEYNLDLSDFEYLGNKPFEKPIEILGNVSNLGGSLIVKTVANAVLKSYCDRCGAEFQMDLKAEGESTVILRESDDDGENTVLAPKGILEVDSVVTDNLILAIPMKHLCKIDCRGLCSKCGAELNKKECKCNLEEVDPRLAVLKDYLN